LNEVICRVVASRERTFELSEIEVVRELAPDLPKVLVQPNQMDQVILNLLNNARDAIGKEGTITVTTRVKEGEVVTSVQDTGCGISEAQMPQIFFPFYTTKGVGKGTGLGLSISYGILKSFDGRFEVESEVGKGSRFIIYLPVANDDTKKQQAAKPGDGHD
jgi:two-component system NtrC family sensor kinase